ncbi:hypothetical protein BHQ23_02580 [Mycobacterium gordonae]|uniref:Uncharacterized protein n=1 Tax=Mycobacterium gordonae TaxID=1778 RepID=A0A1X1WFT0_MYCGO|nr:hypothetical protein BHQ23_02580 [Mycobacterium gordonae]ORV85398.1 hypothetical protein AWC08_25550 [Mycobacterium gordonae]
MNWFEQLMGFTESDYATTQRRLVVNGDTLTSTVNGKSYGIGQLSLPTLAELRTSTPNSSGTRTTVRPMVGDVRRLHADPTLRGALFQVASQFNLLEMMHPSVTPEEGVTRYADDGTQGPACAMAAGAATIYRNYLVAVGGQAGQTATRQLDALAHMGSALSAALGVPVSELWTMHNGYAACTGAGLRAITKLLDGATAEQRDALRGTLAIGLHRGVEVTDVKTKDQVVSQAYCSALPVAYYRSNGDWEAFARLVLESAYEATLLAASQQASTGGSNIVLLTRLGGGAFGNDDAWIDGAMMRALRIVEHAGLDVRIVSHGQPNSSVRAIITEWDRKEQA